MRKKTDKNQSKVMQQPRKAGRPTLEGEPLKRLPIFLSVEEKAGIARLSTNASGWVRKAIQRALKPVNVYGMVCCGDGIEAVAASPLRTVAFLDELLPATQSEQYMLVAQGESMMNSRERRLDIQDGDLLVFMASDDAQPGQFVHYEIIDEYGGRTCGVRVWTMQNDTVTLKATNDAIDPLTGAPLYPDIVRYRDDISVRGVWLRIAISGVRV